MSVEIPEDEKFVGATRTRSGNSEILPDTRHRSKKDAETLPDQAFQSPTRSRAMGSGIDRISQSTTFSRWNTVEEDDRLSFDFGSLALDNDLSKRGRALTKLLKSASSFVDFEDINSPIATPVVPPSPATSNTTSITSPAGVVAPACVVCVDHVQLTSSMILNLQDKNRKLCANHFKEWLKLEDSKRRCVVSGCRRPASYLSYRHRECCHTHFREMFDIDTYVIRLLGSNDPTLRESIVQSSKLIALGIPKDPPFLNSLEGIILFLGEIFVPESSRDGWMKLAKFLVSLASREIISVGDRVEVFGLESVHHNGLHGNVVVINGGRLEVVLETAEVARFKAGNVRKIPDDVVDDGAPKSPSRSLPSKQQVPNRDFIHIRSLLSFVLLTLHHRTCATLSCTCPAHPCPLFSLRVIFISRILIQHFQPLLGHSCREVQDLSIKVMWRLFQFYAVLPPCNRYQALAMQPPSEKNLLGFLSQSFSRKSCLTILNVLLELATMKITLPNIVSTEIASAVTNSEATTGAIDGSNLVLSVRKISAKEGINDNDRSSSNSNSISTISQTTDSLSSSDSNHSQLQLVGIDLGSLSNITFSWETPTSLDLFRCKVENACLLPHIFRLVARAGEADRLEGMKMMFSMLVGKALSVDTVLQMKKWPFWILEIIAALPSSVLHRQSVASSRQAEERDSSTHNAETLTHCVAFFEYIMTHAFKNFPDRRFAFLMCDTLALIRRFSGGWTTKSLAIARKILAVVVKRAITDHRLIRNDVDGIRWRNTIHLAGIITQFTFFVGDDSNVGSARPREDDSGLRSLLKLRESSTAPALTTLSGSIKPRPRSGNGAPHARTWSSSLQTVLAIASNTLAPASSLFSSSSTSPSHASQNVSTNNSSASASSSSSTSPSSFTYSCTRSRSGSPSISYPQAESVFTSDASFSPLSSYSFSPTSTFSVSASIPPLRQSISSSTTFAPIPIDTTGEFSITSSASPLAPLAGSLVPSEPPVTPKSPAGSPPESPPLRADEKASQRSDFLLENHWRTAKKLLWYWDNALDPDLQGVKLHREGGLLLDHPLIADTNALLKLLHLDELSMFGDLSVTAEGKAQLELENKLWKFLDRVDCLCSTSTTTELTDYVKENKKLLARWSKMIGYTFATIEDRGLMEGVLRVPSSGNKEYFFSMTPSALRFNEGTQLLLSHKSFTKIPAADCSGALTVQASVEEEDEKKDKASGGFEFQLNTPKKSFSVIAATSEERDAWLALLALLNKKKYAGGGSQRLSSNLLANTSLMFGSVTHVRGNDDDTVGFIPEGVAPVWVTKQDVTQCHLCKATFSLVRLKHWCRICGQVFCHACCKEKLLLPMYLEPERVCRTCVLEKQRVEHRKKVELMKMMHYRSSVLYKTKDDYLEERTRLRQSGTAD